MVGFLKKLKIELPYDSAIPLLATYPKEVKARIQTDIGTPMFIGALVTAAKRWKPLPVGEWIKMESGLFFSPKKE